MSEFIGLKTAQEFRTNGMAELDKLLVGEGVAKLALLTCMVSNQNGVYSGEPGGGKTSLAIDAYRLIDGIDPERIATIPPQADLTATQLIGGKIDTEKITKSGDGIANSETTSTLITSLIKPDTQVLFVNEINRIAPHALNGLLEAFASRRLDTSAGSIQLNDLLYGVSTMNPIHSRQAAFAIDPAMASRFSIGAAMGEPTEDEAILDGYGEDWEPSPRSVEPITDIETLKAIQHRALKGTAIPDSVWKQHATPELTRVRDRLRDEHGIRESMGRLANRSRMVARTLAVLHGESEVNPTNFNEALRFMVTARLGTLSMKAAQKGIAESVDELLAV